MSEAIWNRSPAEHGAHPLHDLARDWPETNCYVDVWIELLAALGLPVEACLAFTIGCDFEGDQWTFFKPPHRDLEELYGIRVEELTLWRPLLAHVEAQVARRRLPLVEVDAFHLPDTAGTDYARQHTKTTIAIAAVDSAARRLRYFHNRGFHELAGEDFDGLLRVEAPGRLPPYCEIVKLDALERLDGAELRSRALAQTRRHYAARPRGNPIRAYEQGLAEHLRWLKGTEMGSFHAYGFASVRQLGAGFELLASHLGWLDGGSGGAWAEAAASFAAVSHGAKALLLRLARSASSGREQDLSGTFAELAGAWERGMVAIGQAR